MSETNEKKDSEFKKCEEAHVYSAEYDECPFCKGVTIDEELRKQAEEKPEEGFDKEKYDRLIAMCYDMGPRNPDDDYKYKE